VTCLATDPRGRWANNEALRRKVPHSASALTSQLNTTTIELIFYDLRQPKVSDLYIPFRVEQAVGRLEIVVYDAGASALWRVQVAQTTVVVVVVVSSKCSSSSESSCSDSSVSNCCRAACGDRSESIAS
jgi:hypothetical protein